MMNLKEFSKLPILGILRGVGEREIEPLTESAISSGLKTVEITMNTEGAASLIKRMVKAAKNRLTIGAGTVLTTSDMHSALKAGASFIVMPVVVDSVMSYCVKNKIPVFPGAFSPQEIYNAWQKGASMVKVFPAKFLGPAYIKEIKAPFNNIKLLACGGVNAENIQSFFDSGASAVAFGASIFKKERLKNNEFKKIGDSIKELISAYGNI